MKTKLIILLIFMITATAQSQTTISGTITDAKSGERLTRVNIKIFKKSVGTITDFDGNFILKVKDKPPFIIEISLLGYKTQKVSITTGKQIVNLSLTENETALDEIIVSASRTPERIMESPVTIERMGAVAIRNTPSPTFYDGLENLKGVDINTNSLTFKSVNTRGFAAFSNSRFVQLVDGMDNSSPALNFALGNLLGMSELDVKAVEILPGASSALYGANAFNGIMLMTSKSPFDDRGVSFIYKSGITSQQAAGDNIFHDASIRMAHTFSDKFAAKVTLSYLKGTEWSATDYRNTTAIGGSYKEGNRDTDINYNGLNVYGDEVSTNIHDVAKKLEVLIPEFPVGGSALVPSVNVSRTGYKEIDLMDGEAESLKLDVSLHYRPWGNDRTEIIWNTKYGTGNTVYQGQNRYNIKNFILHQHKLEVKGKNFFVRSYITAESAGKSYDARFTAININRRWSPDATWFGTYTGAYLRGALGGLSSDQAHAQAREVADTGRLIPGTDSFKDAFDKVTSDASLTTGSKFVDNTRLNHTDVNLNLRDYIDWAEIQVGGSFRSYSLRSNGTIFTDYDGPINYNEYGIYVQLQKKFLDDKLKLTVSGRYDKAQNFGGNISPRLSLNYIAGEDRNHNFRVSFQTGFRNPTTQDQYVGLNAGSAFLVGSAPDNLDRYTTPSLDVSENGKPFLGGAKTTTLTGRNAYENAFSASSIQNGTFKKANTKYVKPERVTALEIGYRGLIEKVSIDFSTYYNKYKDFIARKGVAVPYYGVVGSTEASPRPNVTLGQIATLALRNGDYKGFGVYTNSTADISSYGLGLGLSTKIFNGFKIGGSYTWSKFDFNQISDPDFEAEFNTPEHKIKIQFGKLQLFKNFGFNVNLRWQNKFLWESPFHSVVIGARTVVDAQINYLIPKWKSTFKLGGANLGGKEYFSAPGTGGVGSQYYISWRFTM